jgi:hypothetical protein
MGIVAPEKRSAVSKAFIVLLVIILSPILIVAVLLHILWGMILYIAIWVTRRKQFVIFIYSESPTWKEYIEREILPYVQNRAVILNWSERRHWKNSLAILAFRYFGGYRNFNPMGMVFRPFHLVKTYRFFEAFRDFKHGNTRTIEEIRKELFSAIGI